MNNLIAAATLALLISTPAIADDTSSSGFSKEVIDVLLESRSQQPASQATPEERASAEDELASIYAVSNLPAAIELGEAPRIAAQIELQRRIILFNAFATNFLTSNAATDQEIFDTYQEQIALSPPEEFKARHILVDAQGAAMGLIEELQAGADFEALAREHSTGSSGEQGGDLDWFPVNAMVKPFSDAVVKLENGEFTAAPVQTQFGWHVILREDSRESTPPPLESVRDVISQRIAQQKFLDYVENLQSTSDE